MGLRSDLINGQDTLAEFNCQLQAGDEFIMYRDGLPYRVPASQLLAGYKLAGFYDYNDAGTHETPISVAADTPTVVTNDGAGDYTLKTFAPDSLGDIWDAETNSFDFSSLSLGDMVDIRVDLQFTTSNTYQTLDLSLHLGSGLGAYTIPFEVGRVFKTAQAYSVAKKMGVYIGNDDTKNNPAQLKIMSDDDASVVVNGWYCQVFKRLI